jgi:hypothetical protein
MSNYIYGSDASIKKVQEIANIIKGNPPFVKKLPITVPSIKGQRPTKSSTLEKFLSSEGGFNWGLWRYPSVVQVPEPVAKQYQAQLIKDGDKEFASEMASGFLNDGFWYGRWDGDHRKHIWEYTFKNDPNLECMVYPVETVEVANELFVKIQKMNQKGLTPEDAIINQYYGKDQAALKLASFLEYCGISVKNSDEGIMPSSATKDTPSTRIRLFERSVKEAGLDETKMACDILISGFSKLNKWNNEISPTLMFGLAILFKARPLAMKNGLNKRLIEYIHGVIITTPKQKDLVKLWGGQGGDKHNKEAESVAYGLAQLFKGAVDGGSYGGNKNMCTALSISTLDVDLGLKP